MAFRIVVNHNPPASEVRADALDQFVQRRPQFAFGAAEQDPVGERVAQRLRQFAVVLVEDADFLDTG